MGRLEPTDPLLQLRHYQPTSKEKKGGGGGSSLLSPILATPLLLALPIVTILTITMSCFTYG